MNYKRTPPTEYIKWSAIEKLCCLEAQAFRAALDKHGINDGDFAAWLEGDVEDLADILEPTKGAPEQAMTEITEAWKVLQNAFAEATRVGSSCLELDAECVDKQGEEYYILISAARYTVSNLYQYSPAAKKLMGTLKRLRNANQSS